MWANSNPSEGDSLKKDQKWNKKSKWWWAHPAQYKLHDIMHQLFPAW